MNDKRYLSLEEYVKTLTPEQLVKLQEFCDKNPVVRGIRYSKNGQEPIAGMDTVIIEGGFKGIHFAAANEFKNRNQ